MAGGQFIAWIKIESNITGLYVEPLCYLYKEIWQVKTLLLVTCSLSKIYKWGGGSKMAEE